MYGQYPTPRRVGDTTPRLPPISSPTLNDQSAMALLEKLLLDRTYTIQSDMQSITDERRARQMLEEQVRVITLVCKKLNQDIEALDSQLNQRNLILNTLEFKNNELQTNSVSLNKELQFKLARHDSVLNKLESENMTVTNILKDLQSRQSDGSRGLMMRMTDIENRINELNSKFDSILVEQNLVLKNVEGDTVKQLQLIDGRTRSMLEDIRNQVYQNKTNHDTEMIKIESRLAMKIEEAIRNNDKYDRLDRKYDEYTQSVNKRLLTIEDEFQRYMNKLTLSNEKLDSKVNQVMDDRLTRQNSEYEKLRREMKLAFDNIQDSIMALQNVVEGKIKLAEDRLEKEIEKIRKMSVYDIENHVSYQKSPPPPPTARPVMDDPPLAATSSSSVTATYESIMKRLVNIIRNHRVVNDYKPLEDLWELCHAPPPPQQPADPEPKPLKRDSSKTALGPDKEAKKMRLTVSSNPITKPKTTSPLSKTENDLNLIVSTTNQSINENKSPPYPANGGSQLDNPADFTDLNSMVADMFDFSCSICKQFNQETNNKLIECRQCTQLYHQQCHEPKILKEAIESNTGARSDESVDESRQQLAWYFPKCMRCASPTTNREAENITQPLTTKSPPLPDNLIIVNSTPVNNPEPFRKEIKSQTLVSNANEQKQVKGLAALATKLNHTNGTSPNQTQSPSSKSNHDDLFKKFRQSVNNSTSSNPPLSGLDLKRKFLASSSTSGSNPTVSQSQPVKKPLFNLNSTSAMKPAQATNLIVNSVVKK